MDKKISTFGIIIIISLILIAYVLKNQTSPKPVELSQNSNTPTSIPDQPQVSPAITSDPTPTETDDQLLKELNQDTGSSFDLQFQQLGNELGQ